MYVFAKWICLRRFQTAWVHSQDIPDIEIWDDKQWHDVMC